MREFIIQIILIVFLVIFFFLPVSAKEKDISFLYNLSYHFISEQKNMFENEKLKKEFLSLFMNETERIQVQKIPLCLLKKDIIEKNNYVKFSSKEYLEKLFDKYCHTVKKSSRFLKQAKWQNFLYETPDKKKLCKSRNDCALILEDTKKWLVLGWDRHGVEVFGHDGNYHYSQIKMEYDIRKKYPHLTEDFVNKFVEIHIPNGGMGNQLFGYWTGVVYALKNKKEPVFAQKNYIENIFKLPVETGKVLPINYQQQPEFIRRYIHNFSRNGSSGHHVRSDKNYVYINGYVQSWKNFTGYEDYIQKQTVFKEEMPDINKELAKKMQAENSVSVHIRRGNYVGKGYILLREEYYNQAIEYMTANLDNPHFYIFSNDIEWVKENIKTDFPHTYVDWNKKDTHDFWLMMNCKNHIIANSTFSWWSSFLSKNKDKIIVAPDKHASWDLNWNDLLSPNFIVIDVPIYYWHKEKGFVYEDEKKAP